MRLHICSSMIYLHNVLYTMYTCICVCVRVSYIYMYSVYI